MPDDLVAYLCGGRLVVAATIDEDGEPYTMVMNSAIAIDAHTVRFCLDHRTHTLVNLRADNRMMLEVIGDGLIYGIRGTATVIRDQMDHAPIPSALVELAVEAVKRDLPPGVEVDAPAFRWGALAPFMTPVEPPMFEELRTYGR
ncbi:MAG: pyridoxamine 5'-phosphate oxidase family protein [Chloroflexota bacterium]